MTFANGLNAVIVAVMTPGSGNDVVVTLIFEAATNAVALAVIGAEPEKDEGLADMTLPDGNAEAEIVMLPDLVTTGVKLAAEAGPKIVTVLLDADAE